MLLSEQLLPRYFLFNRTLLEVDIVLRLTVSLILALTHLSSPTEKDHASSRRQELCYILFKDLDNRSH
jgi:hypothetical protein